MNRNGLTISFIISAESANYGEGIGNITSLKKMSRGDGNQYTYISRQALRYNMMNQLSWDNTPVSVSKKVVQFAPEATIVDYPEIDLFGYMKTVTKDGESKGSASTRSAVVRLSNAISLEPFNADLDFLTNKGLADRIIDQDNSIAQSEIHKSFYTYTITIDLDRVGIDGDLSITNEEKSKRVTDLLRCIQFLYRDIKGRRENLSPLFMVGGLYERKNPYYSNVMNMKDGKINIDSIKSIFESSSDTQEHTYFGLTKGIFKNEKEIIENLNIVDISECFSSIIKDVYDYYE